MYFHCQVGGGCWDSMQQPLLRRVFPFSCIRRAICASEFPFGGRALSFPSERREKSRSHSGRGIPSSREPRKSGPRSMEERNAVLFNRKRANGNEKNGSPRILPLKTRKLDPTSTISYVQILGTGMDTQDTSSSVLLFFNKQRFIFNAGEAIHSSICLSQGLQRFCYEHKIKLSKIDHIFLTRVSSETAGGLPGLLLTLAGIGEEGMSVNIWGPSDLSYLIKAMTFIPKAAMVHTHRIDPVPNSSEGPDTASNTGSIVLLDNELIKLSAIFLRPYFFNKSLNLCDISEPDSLDVNISRDTNIFSVPMSAQSESVKREGPVSPGDISVIYVFELPEIKGKFDPQKAVALGLKAGPKYHQLQLGNSVQSDRLEIVVHPSDVLGPSIPGPIVLLVDCPTIYHLHNLLSTGYLDTYYTGSGNPDHGRVKSVSCVIHLGPTSVTMDANYQMWIKRFSGAHHIMAGHARKNVEIPILKSSARLVSRLNYLCPQFFPVPGFWPIEPLKDHHVNLASLAEDFQIPSGTVAAENLLKFHLRPYTRLGLDRSGIPSTQTSSEVITELLSEIPEVADISKIIGQLWKASGYTIPVNDNKVMFEEPPLDGCASESGSAEVCTGRVESFHDKLKADLPSCLEDISREDMEIVLLGTGSSYPCKYRNVSSIYINLFSKGSLLLDCGEGTLAQLKRRFGLNGADDVIKSLRCIWISHIHADHHTGLARVLAVRTQLLKGVPHDPVIVIGPRILKNFLYAYSRLEDLDMQFLDCKDTTEASWELFAGLAQRGHAIQQNWTIDCPALKRLKQILVEAGLESLISVPVVHCPQSYGFILKSSERKNSLGKSIPGWQLVYSGDTRPCQALVDASRGATVLIHEATFEDAMMEEAIQKNHSTTREAIEVGDKAGVYRIILTHFSQRYPKIPVFDENYMHKTCIGFDLMSVNLADLPILPKIFPYLKLLFRNEIASEENDDTVIPVE